MKALITGATSGIGLEMAKILSDKGYDLIIASRNMEKMEEFKKMVKTEVISIVVDLADSNDAYKLYEEVKGQDIDILINNSGYGYHGDFLENSLEDDINMMELNMKSLHILTKLFLEDFKKKNRGYILNVASSAAFLPGPTMATYYATKAYVLRLSEGIYEELRRKNINVHVTALCPGPVDTLFNQRAGIKGFSIKALSARKVAEVGLDAMFKKKPVIIPGFKMKAANFFMRFLPEKTLIKVSYAFQNKKIK